MSYLPSSICLYNKFNVLYKGGIVEVGVEQRNYIVCLAEFSKLFD